MPVIEASLTVEGVDCETTTHPLEIDNLAGVSSALALSLLSTKRDQSSIQLNSPRYPNNGDKVHPHSLKIQAMFRRELERERFEGPQNPRVTVLKPFLPSKRTLQLRGLRPIIGATVDIRAIDNTDEIIPVDPSKITEQMISQMKLVTEQYTKHRPVRRIEYILNASLYEIYHRTIEVFRELGKDKQEIIGYHGTNQANVDAYIP
jgi:hypothetical protein